ncbi:MAG: hypothetical protein ACREIB_13840 [Pseudomonadota bacterium]
MCLDVKPGPVFVGVQKADQARGLIAPTDCHVAGCEHLAQLVAHQVDDGLEVALGCDALLDGVDDLQLTRQRSDLCHLLFAFGPHRLGPSLGEQPYGRLFGQRNQAVPIGKAQASG